MLQKLKVTSYALIVLLVLPSQAVAVDKYADSCKGWDCSHEGQVCPQGAEGARGTSFICTDSKWVPILVGSCKGWECSQDGQLCPQGAEGAKDTDYVCYDGKWTPAKYCDVAEVGHGGWSPYPGRELRDSWDKIITDCTLSEREICERWQRSVSLKGQCDKY